MPNRNKEIIQFANDELVSQGNLNIVEETFAIDYVAHADGKEYKGIDFVKRYAKQLRKAIPDLEVVKIKFFIESSDTITWERTSCGTHLADMKGIPPSGKKVKWRDMVVTRFKEGKITEEWVVSELAGELLLKIPRR